MNCLDCIYAKLDYEHDGYTPLVVCKHTGFQATWSPASFHCCKDHIQDKLIVADGCEITHYVTDYLADRFLRSTEGIGPNSRLSEFPITPGELATVLANAFAVTIPEAKYSPLANPGTSRQLHLPCTIPQVNCYIHPDTLSQI